MKDCSWKAIACFVYLFICVFDFVVVPVWFGVARSAWSDIAHQALALDQASIELQLEYIRALSAQHEPFTLRNGGLFHLAFGALLTGAAISGNSQKSQ